jgi:hypothetical protein
MTLDNLFKIQQLKQEPADERETRGLIRAATRRREFIVILRQPV